MRYDYIVVGGGSAGAVVAARLSEDPDTNVLLLEAGGPDEGDIFSVPSLWPQQFTTKYDWDYRSEPEPWLGNRPTYLPRGKVLGGTSSMNAMLYVRGVPLDYEEWKAAGCAGWGWDDVLPLFKRGERNRRFGGPLHGQDGELNVVDRISDNRIVDAFIASAKALGYPFNNDFNGPTQDGVGYFQLTQENAERASTSVAFLKPAAKRPNLRIELNCFARRIVFDGRRASGVEVEQNGEVMTFSAEREIVLSAGAYNSPQLLLLSGIGPAQELADMGIAPIADLPVGERLQEHPGVAIVLATDRDTLYGFTAPENWERYRKEGRGPLATNIVEAGGFFRTLPSCATPDVESTVLPSTVSDGALGPITQPGYTLLIELLKPDSVGKVSLRSAHPTAKPRIVHNHFSTEEDRRAIREGVRINMRIAAQAPLHGYEKGRLQYPESDSDADLDAFVAEYAMPLFHPSSSCSMGYVVDSELRVMGVGGLRVADASLMPTIIRGNPNAAIIMIGEKAADLIRSNR